MMFGDGADGASAVLRLVTPRPLFAKRPLLVGPAEAPALLQTPTMPGR